MKRSIYNLLPGSLNRHPPRYVSALDTKTKELLIAYYF